MGTTTPVQIYSKNTKDREILFQNTHATLYVAVSTHSGVSFSTGTARFLLPPKPTGVTTNATYSLWGIADPTLGSSMIEVVGCAERDLRDP